MGRASLGGTVAAPAKSPAQSPRMSQAQSFGCSSAPELARALFRQPMLHAVPLLAAASWPTDGILPFGVVEAVTRTIWASARAQAEREHAAEVASGGSSGSAASMPKRRRAVGAEAADDGRAFPATYNQSQPSQTQSAEAAAAASGVSLQAAEEVVQLACGTLQAALREAGHEGRGLAESLCSALRRGVAASARGSPAEDIVLSSVRAMSLCAVAYWREVSQDLGRAAASLARFLEVQRRLYWRPPAWRGVNLGGWLLLEPGPSHALFQTHSSGASCEWELLERMREDLGPAGAAAAIQAHRNSFVTEDDFRKIKALGLNAVRIPFGYWIVTGPADGDVYVGPGLEHLDRALGWCKAHGLQAMLDLHGAPGGESGEKPCGRERKDWTWENWRFQESIKALRIIARRYKGHPSVTGISVCNEPSETVPGDILCQFYDEAVRAIREEGMPPDEVSILLPVYRSERLDEIWRIWNKAFDGFGRHANVAFDLHLYHCFGAWWQRQGFGSQLRMTKRHRKILRRVPAVVGEWSLALPQRSLAENPQDEDQVYQAFAAAQLDAYSQASHGWFFWNWCDSPLHHPGWDVRTCLERGWVSKAQLSGNVV
eukprot:CAMPEP_0115071614 /NCGR_PEP_ID=MMETSP0227-20121206/13769_1 /TAXON_ID=89957 /ORGANISM="Polarella glacialis, Strain CCMP 1383" /LENGTH=600 /DNA_ID=CAMNT_0002458263 /DNA_START=197 /DNA_END=2000 /DNA_ORIENTATION=+